MREVLFELRRVGGYVRVAAIDADSNTEVTIVGDPSVGEAELKRLALQKLRYVLRKKQVRAQEPDKPRWPG